MATAVYERKPVRSSLVWWLRWAGILAFVLILFVQLPRSQQAQLTRMDLRWLGLCMLLTIGQLLLEALAWHSLLSTQRIRHPYPKTLLVYLASQYLGLVTPGHVGEFLAAGYISQETGITFGYALSSVVVKKALAWLTIIGFGVFWGVPLLADVTVRHGVKEMSIVTAVIIVVLAGGITLWVFSLRQLARKWQRLSPWQIDMEEFWAGMRHLGSPALAFPLVLTAGAFVVLFFQLDAVLKAIGVSLPFLLVSRIMALSRIAARLMPVSGFGVGTKDAAIVILLSQHGVEVPLGLTAVLLLLVCSYLVTLLLSGICWWVKPLVIRRAARPTS